MLSVSRAAFSILALVLTQAVALRHSGSRRGKVDTDVVGNEISSLSLERKTQLMTMQMNAASAWMESDSLGDMSANLWLGDNVSEWISSRLQEVSASLGELSTDNLPRRNVTEWISSRLQDASASLADLSTDKWFGANMSERIASQVQIASASFVDLGADQWLRHNVSEWISSRLQNASASFVDLSADEWLRENVSGWIASRLQDASVSVGNFSDKWLGDNVIDWISSRLQQNASDAAATKLISKLLANKTDHTIGRTPDEYHEFEKGTTAVLGGDKSDIFWSLDMKNFLLSLNASKLPKKHDADRHIRIRRQLGARMLLEETDETNGWIQKGVSDYAALYMAELQHRTSVMLSHISKSGGTDLCSCGFEAGCRASTEQEAQCNIMPGLPQPQSSLSKLSKLFSKADDCSTADSFSKQNHATLMNHEIPLMDAGLCHQFWNVIVLRDPLDRIVSHLTYLNTTTDSIEWRPDMINPVSLFEAVPLLTNNFFIRNLIGSKGYDLPFGEVTMEHLEEAKHALESFDLVLMKTGSLKEDLYDYVGWDCDHQPAKTGAPELFFKALTDTWTPEQWQLLKDANSLDSQLVQHARMLERVDKKVYRHPFFTFFAHQLQHESCIKGKGHCGFLCK